MQDSNFATLVSAYSQRLPTIGSELHGPLQTGDIPQVKLLTHRLRGTAPGYGFIRLGAMAGAIEDAVREGHGAETLLEAAKPLLAALSSGEYQ